MAKTVGRLKQGDLLIQGELDERLPSITKGLTHYFPFDYSEGGRNTAPLLNYSIWEPGQTGKVGLFGVYSSSVNNTRVAGVDPFGSPTTLWKCDGLNSGIYCDPVSIDNGKLYRLSWWVNRKVNGDGRFYAGCNGYGSTNGVMNLSGSYNTNPYFWYTGQTPSAAELPEDTWMLIVAHIFPSTHTGTARHADSGRYTLKGKYGDTHNDFKWAPETTTARGRTLSIYQATATNIEHYHSYMRMDVCDGTEPSLQELLTGEANMTKPLTATDLAFTREGVAIEEASNNVVNNHGQASTPVSGDGSPTLRIVDVGATFRGRKVTRYIPGTSGNFYINGSSSISTGTSSTAWTSTFYIKRVDGTPISSVGSYLYVNGNATDNQNLVTEEVEDGWYRVTRVRSGLVSGYVTLFGGYGLATGKEYLIAEWKVEPKAFATAYSEGATGASKLYIDSIGGFTDYTITGSYFPRHPFKNNDGYVESPKSAARLFSIYDRTIAGHMSYQYWQNGSGLAGPYLNRSGSYSGSNIHRYYELERHKPIFFSAVKSGGIFTFKLYQDGWKEGHVASVLSTARLDDLRFGDSTIMDGIYRDLAIYNRALSNDEVEKNLRKSFSLGKTGGIKSEVKEQASISKQGIYFPLGMNAQSLVGESQPVEVTNDAYGNAGLWVGDAANNFAQNAISAHSPYYTYSRDGDRHFCLRHSTSSSPTVALQCPVFSAAVTAGTVYTISGYLYLNGVPHKTTVTSLSTYHTATLKRKSSDDGYFEYTQTFNASGWILHSNLCGASIGDTVEIRQLQIETQSFASAYTPTSRASTKVALPYNVIDCKQDFTVTGWFYPKVVGDGAYRPWLTRNRISSNVTSQRILIMPSSTSSKQLRAWYGSGGSETTITLPSSFQIQEDAWNFFSFRREGGTVSLFHGVNGVIGKTSNTLGAYLNTDEDPTTWGWLIGEYSGSKGNGYARDYTFIQRGLSDGEVEKVFRTQMQAKKNGIVEVQLEIKEGRVL